MGEILTKKQSAVQGERRKPQSRHFRKTQTLSLRRHKDEKVARESEGGGK